VSRVAPAGIAKDLAIGIGITSILIAITLQSPILGFFCMIGIPLPTIFYRAKLGRKIGMLVPACALFLLALMLGGISLDILYFFELVLIGFVLCELFEQRLSVEKTMTYTCAAVVASGLVFLIVYSAVLSTGIGSLVSGYVSKNLEATLALYESMGMSPENLRLFQDSIEQIQYVLVRIVPAMAIASTLFLTWTSLLIAKPLLKRRNLFYPDYGSLNTWKAPELLVWVVIGCGLMLLIPYRPLKLLGFNGLLILLTIYFFQGIAIVSYYFEKKRFPRALRVFLYSLIALQQLILLIVIGLGFFDMWLNFRKLGVKKK